MRITGDDSTRLWLTMWLAMFVYGSCLLNPASADPFQNPDAAPAQNDDQTTSEQAADKMAEPLPDWVLSGGQVDSDGTQFILVSSSERSSELDAETEMWMNLKSEIDQKIDELIAPGAAAALALSPDYIQDTLLVPRHIHKQIIYLKTSPELAEIAESVLQSPPRHYQFYALAKLDKHFEAWARATWEERLIRSRVQQAGLIGISVLAGLTLLLGYFQLDHKTRGFYSGRLQTISLVIVLVLVVAALALSNSFVWL